MGNIFSKTRTQSMENKDDELVQCFSGCQSVQRRDLRSMIDAKVETNLNNPTFRQLFDTFASKGHTNIRPKALKALDCYELCKRVQDGGYEMDDDTVIKIKDLCQDIDLEAGLDEATQESVDAVSVDCRLFIERSKDYERFMQKLREKGRI